MRHFAEMYPGENDYLAEISRQRREIRYSEWFPSLMKTVQSITKEFTRVMAEICNDETRETFRNKDDKYFCYRTTCENCGRCDIKTISAFRVYIKKLDRYSNYEDVLIGVLMETDRYSFQTEMSNKLKELRLILKEQYNGGNGIRHDTRNRGRPGVDYGLERRSREEVEV